MKSERSGKYSGYCASGSTRRGGNRLIRLQRSGFTRISIQRTPTANSLLVLFQLLLLHRYAPKIERLLCISLDVPISSSLGSLSRKGICENERRV